jgi:hypothetical protein
VCTTKSTSSSQSSDAQIQVIKLKDRAWLKLVHDIAPCLNDESSTDSHAELHLPTLSSDEAIDRHSGGVSGGVRTSINRILTKKPSILQQQQEQVVNLQKNPAYLVINSYQQANGGRGYRLKVGDLIKIGRVRLRVTEICDNSSSSSSNASKKVQQ